MAPNPKVKAAFLAMRDLGISEETVKPVLKKLLKLYEKNWELIEAENYRALLDAIFDNDDPKAIEEKKKSNIDEEEEEALPQLQRPLKRLRRHQDNQATPSATDSAPLLLQPKLEEGEEPQPLQVQKPDGSRGNKALVVVNGGVDQSQPVSDENQGFGSQLRGRDKGKGPISSKTVAKRSRSHEIHIGSRTALPNQHLSLIVPKDEPYTDDVPAPLAVIPADSSNKRVSSVEKDKISGPNSINASVPLLENGECRDASIRASSTEKHDSDFGNSAFSLEVASSPLGEVKLTLSCNSTLRGSGFHIPSLDAVLKLMDEKSLQSYKTLDPNFSITKLMTDICQCFLELGTGPTSTDNSIEALPGASDSNNDGGDKQTLASAISDPCHDGTQDCGKDVNVELSGNVGANEAVPSGSIVDNTDKADGLDIGFNNCKDQMQSIDTNGCNEIVDEMESDRSILPHCGVEGDKGNTFMLTSEEATITSGEERVSIGWINEVNQQSPSPFRYIPQNLIFCKAAVTFSLAQISDDKCCSTCSGDCVSSSAPCGCACAPGGKYAYTVKGLLSEEFLDGCISMSREPKKCGHFFCKQCPLQVSRNEALEPCKGHEKRNFIKECWMKCWCSKRCNNRVVQRGITCSLQVFMSSEGKGWGVRTLQDLPKGAFVCEYVGEILTHKEVLERNVDHAQHGSYQVFLDSAWDSISPEDNEALCLDSTCYGNIARFINHRCFDANLIGIPVEVETPKHHYYHLAFFTTRTVSAQEELTWDYGVDFDDDNPSVNSFKCVCGSQFCRNLKRSNKVIIQT